MTDAHCPETPAIERLLLGLAGDEEAVSLEQHLLDCDRCCHTARTLEIEAHLDDTLAAALRPHAGLDEIAQDGPVREAMARLGALRPGADGQTAETMASAGDSTQDVWDLEKLFDPPDGEGELGRFGGYRVLRVLGAGGMGLVFEAEDPQLRRRVALKVMKRSLASRDEHHQRFLREARAAAAIDHPHIVTVHQVGEHGGVPFMAMQLLKGETLDDRLRREGKEGSRLTGQDSARRSVASGPLSVATDNGPLATDNIENPKSPLPLAETLRIGRETAEALAEAHSRNLIHRDIKPGNIWLEGARGWVKLVDFGLAHAAEDIHLTQTGAILGTPAYMSPEQARGETVDDRSDLYSLGAVLYKLATGDVPFRGASTMAVLTALATESPRPPSELNPGIPPALNYLIVRLLAKKPDQRFESAEAVVEAIRAIEAELEERKREGQSEGAMTGKPPRRRGASWLSAAGAAALLLAGIVVVVRDKHGREVGRLPVPDGGSVGVESNPAGRPQADARPEPPGSTNSRSDAATPTRNVSEKGAKHAPPAPAAHTIAAGSASVGPRLPSTAYRLPASDAPRPFVLLREGKEVRAFKSTAGALAELRAGDAIEVMGNGPFPLPIIHLTGKPLTLRAGVGFQPAFVRSEKARQSGNEPWITVNDAPLTLEGIELREESEQPGMHRDLLIGGGAAWHIRRCLLRKGDSHNGSLIAYAGPGLLVADSVLVAGFSHRGIEIGPDTQASFENNLFRSGAFTFFSVQGPAGQKLRFVRNTFVGSGPWLNCFEAENQQDQEAMEVVAEENVFGLGVLLGGLPNLDSWRRHCRWTGHRNLYGVGEDFIDWINADGRRQTIIKGNDLAGWNKFWGEQEDGALLTSPRTLEYEAAWLPDDATDPLPRLRHWLDPQRLSSPSAKSAGDLLTADESEGAAFAAGPDWRLVGPGQAYLRALAESGHAVADDQLCPEALEDGAVVVMRDGQPAAGYATVGQAVAEAADGDTVEIRSDGRFAGLNRDSQGAQPKRLTLRAAYGYRPTIATCDGTNSLGLADGDVWSIEGLHFTGAVVVPVTAAAADEQPGPRLLNCSFEPEIYPTTLCLVSRNTSADAAPLEVTNCLLSNGIAFAGPRLRMLNSATAPVWLSAPADGQAEQSLELDRCVVWSSADLFSLYAIGYGAANVVARRTWFEFDGQLCKGERVLSRWKGGENVYCHGPRTFASQLSIDDLAGWRARWSSDADSREGDAVYLDPRFYRLLPDNPGRHAAQDGGDLGVELVRLGLGR